MDDLSIYPLPLCISRVDGSFFSVDGMNVCGWIVHPLEWITYWMETLRVDGIIVSEIHIFFLRTFKIKDFMYDFPDISHILDISHIFIISYGIPS